MPSQPVRERLSRFNAEGVDELGDRPGAGRKPRLTEQERGIIITLAKPTPPGKWVRLGDERCPAEPEQEAYWSFDALTRVAHDQGILVERSQIRRILRKEGLRWRRPRSWAESADSEIFPKEHGSLPAPLTLRRGDDPLPRRTPTGEPAYLLLQHLAGLAMAIPAKPRWTTVVVPIRSGATACGASVMARLSPNRPLLATPPLSTPCSTPWIRPTPQGIAT